MNRKRIVRKNRRKREVYLKKIVIGIFLLVLTVGTAASVGNHFVNAEEHIDSPVEMKYYKSIEIQSGDTLWDIAKEYSDDHYDSIYDYVNEVMNINHLITDEIHAEDYLTVPYYESL